MPRHHTLATSMISIMIYSKADLHYCINYYTEPFCILLDHLTFSCIFLCRGDFVVMFGDGNSSVLQLMELAFIEMCKISYNSNMRSMRQPLGTLYKRFIYNTMVWGRFFGIILLCYNLVTGENFGDGKFFK